MDIKDIEAKISEIKAMKGDDEKSHRREDDLYRCFIEHVVQYGDDDLANMGKLILITQSIEFSRWCA